MKYRVKTGDFDEILKIMAAKELNQVREHPILNLFSSSIKKQTSRYSRMCFTLKNSLHLLKYNLRDPYDLLYEQYWILVFQE